MDEYLNELEHAVLRKLFNDDHPVLAGFWQQLQHAIGSKRTYSGVGFFLDLHFPKDVRPVPHAPPAFRFGDVVAELEGLEHGAGFVVFADDGVLQLLEGYSFEGTWPSPAEVVSLRYHPFPRSLDFAARSKSDSE